MVKKLWSFYDLNEIIIGFLVTNYLVLLEAGLFATNHLQMLLWLEEIL